MQRTSQPVHGGAEGQVGVGQRAAHQVADAPVDGEVEPHQLGELGVAVAQHVAEVVGPVQVGVDGSDAAALAHSSATHLLLRGHLSCDEQPEETFGQRLFTSGSFRQQLLTLWNAVATEADALCINGEREQLTNDPERHHQEDAVLQAGLEVVHHRPLEVLDAVRRPQNVALIWIQLQGVIGFHLHQSAQELRAVLEMAQSEVTSQLPDVRKRGGREGMAGCVTGGTEMKSREESSYRINRDEEQRGKQLQNKQR
ncbi:hypothetical protein EYF80_032555 [Liparis tanakae]|uniref:Uncharacterized protein n=1 Tax=Liparis tanakae TaxID=230148 RepID=A0A4Z2GV35_9TELE|nr:hypothetical protein EYF80_032555 [Liparis tanakae]